MRAPWCLLGASALPRPPEKTKSTTYSKSRMNYFGCSKNRSGTTIMMLTTSMLQLWQVCCVFLLLGLSLGLPSAGSAAPNSCQLVTGDAAARAAAAAQVLEVEVATSPPRNVYTAALTVKRVLRRYRGPGRLKKQNVITLTLQREPQEVCMAVASLQVGERYFVFLNAPAKKGIAYKAVAAPLPYNRRNRRLIRQEVCNKCGARRPPKSVSKLPESDSAVRGTGVNFTCVFDGSPLPTIKWYKDDEEIMLGQGGRRASAVPSHPRRVSANDVAAGDSLSLAAGFTIMNTNNMSITHRRVRSRRLIRRRRRRRRRRRSGRYFGPPVPPSLATFIVPNSRLSTDLHRRRNYELHRKQRHGRNTSTQPQIDISPSNSSNSYYSFHSENENTNNNDHVSQTNDKLYSNGGSSRYHYSSRRRHRRHHHPHHNNPRHPSIASTSDTNKTATTSLRPMSSLFNIPSSSDALYDQNNEDDGILIRHARSRRGGEGRRNNMPLPSTSNAFTRRLRVRNEGGRGNHNGDTASSPLQHVTRSLTGSRRNPSGSRYRSSSSGANSSRGLSRTTAGAAGNHGSRSNNNNSPGSTHRKRKQRKRKKDRNRVSIAGNEIETGTRNNGGIRAPNGRNKARHRQSSRRIHSRRKPRIRPARPEQQNNIASLREQHKNPRRQQHNDHQHPHDDDISNQVNENVNPLLHHQHRSEDNSNDTYTQSSSSSRNLKNNQRINPSGFQIRRPNTHLNQRNRNINRPQSNDINLHTSQHTTQPTNRFSSPRETQDPVIHGSSATQNRHRGSPSHDSQNSYSSHAGDNSSHSNSSSNRASSPYNNRSPVRNSDHGTSPPSKTHNSPNSRAHGPHIGRPQSNNGSQVDRIHGSQTDKDQTSNNNSETKRPSPQAGTSHSRRRPGASLSSNRSGARPPRKAIRRVVSSLSISSVEETHAGIYKCVATSKKGKSEQAVTLTVIPPLDPGIVYPCPYDSFCLNGGTCMFFKFVGELVCQCVEGFKGQRCQEKEVYPTYKYRPRLMIGERRRRPRESG